MLQRAKIITGMGKFGSGKIQSSMMENDSLKTLTIVGGGLAGSEAAWQAAEHGISVRLYEMRPQRQTGAHVGDRLAEVICSNSLGSRLPDRATGLLQEELKCMKSLLLSCAEATAVPAGGALAVDREAFSSMVTEKIQSHPCIEIVREEVTEIPQTPAIIASGPLTSPALSKALVALSGEEHFFFYDAIAPIISANSINIDIAYRASRYGKGEQEDGDYINCPFTKEQYQQFVQELLNAERIQLHSFEQELETGVRAGAKEYFERCLPVEVIASRGEQSLAFGPMRPVGLRDPRTGKRPYAVVQLRQDNLAGSLYNLVGFQTNLTFPEQRRIFRLIPGLEQAEFVRFGQMHRNTFLASPKLLRPTLQSNWRDDLFFAGQLVGVEGYMGNIACGCLAGWNAARFLKGESLLVLPPTTMLGALCHYITHAEMKDFQPMKANYGILPPLENAERLGKRERARLYGERSLRDLSSMLKCV